MTDIQTLLDKHEGFKEKGLRLTEDDLFNWIMLRENMMDVKVEKRSEYMEEKRSLEIEIGLRKIELKNEVKEDGKKIHTESTADAVINKEFAKKRLEIDTLKLSTDSLDNKIQTIPEYINVVKLTMKR